MSGSIYFGEQFGGCVQVSTATCGSTHCPCGAERIGIFFLTPSYDGYFVICVRINLQAH